MLDQQLQATVAGFDHTLGTIVRVDKNSAQLKEALEGNAARIIVTTLQKFPVVVQAAAEDAKNGEAKEVAGRHFAVIVDEAHSSTSGEAVKDLKRRRPMRLMSSSSRRRTVASRRTCPSSRSPRLRSPRPLTCSGNGARTD